MSCYLFKEGTSVVLHKSVRRSFHGTMLRFSAGTTGEVTAVDRKKHTIQVRFPGTQTVFTIDAHAVTSKTRVKHVTHGPRSPKVKAQTEKLKDKVSKAKQTKLDISKKRK